MIVRDAVCEGGTAADKRWRGNIGKDGQASHTKLMPPKFMQSLPILKEERGSDELCNTNSDSMIRPFLVSHNCVDTIFSYFFVFVFSTGFESTP